MLRVRNRRYISQFQGMKKGDTVGEPRVLHRDNHESRDASVLSLSRTTDLADHIVSGRLVSRIASILMWIHSIYLEDENPNSIRNLKRFQVSPFTTSNSSQICTVQANPDISGIGVRISIYTQTLISFAPPLIFVSDGFMDSVEYGSRRSLSPVVT